MLQQLEGSSPTSLLLQTIHGPQTAVCKLCWYIKVNNLSHPLLWGSLAEESKPKQPTPQTKPTKQLTCDVQKDQSVLSACIGPLGKVRPSLSSQVATKKRSSYHQKHF